MASREKSNEQRHDRFVCEYLEKVIEHQSPSKEAATALWTIMIIYVCSEEIRLHCLNCHLASLK